MDLTGQNHIGNTKSSDGNVTFMAVNPASNQELQPAFHEADRNEVDRAVVKAHQAFGYYRNRSGADKAVFLEAIAEEIMALGDELIERCMQETALPVGRLTSERGRTVNQLKLFASVLREGSWPDARIDRAQPDREPLPKPDIRSMHIAIGPVGIFGAGNFPLAFSVAGGDTASALAAGCTIVVKAHPAHPGTCELVAEAIINAARKTDMPDGVFSMLHGRSNDVGMAIVRHPLIRAIGFTGSFRGGKALYGAACSRPEPIPVHAEMGSTNPVFILPGALRDHFEKIAEGLTASVTLGVGQFCTNPGLVFLEKSEMIESFGKTMAAKFSSAESGIMLTSQLQAAFEKGTEALSGHPDVNLLARGKVQSGENQGIPSILMTSAQHFLQNRQFGEEVFGPLNLTVTAETTSELLKIAEELNGQLTATIWATDRDMREYRELIDILEQKVGRLIFNGFPTGVEVCHSMIHGGPFPATTDSRTTSVGTTAINRFTRPVCYQDFPDAYLPDELKDGNPLKILRLVDGEYMR